MKNTMELLLLMCLCVSTRTGKTSADENGVMTVAVSQGNNAILPCSSSTKEDISLKLFKWRKDGRNVFHYDSGNHYNNGFRGQDPQFTGRVSFFQDHLRSGNASVQIQNVMIEDRGIYSCEISGLSSGIQTFNIELVVNVPTLHATLDSDVILPCSLPGKDLRQQIFDWKKDGQDVFLYDNGHHYNNGKTGQFEYFRNRVEFFQDQLQFGNASIRIKNTKLTDSGNYSCGFPDPKVVHHKLVVGVLAKPSVRTINQTDDWALLWCEVPGASPKPSVEWHDNSGNKLLDKEIVVSQDNFILETSVNKKGNYTCVATQMELHHKSSITTFIHIAGSKNRAEGKKVIKFFLLLLLILVDLLLP